MFSKNGKRQYGMTKVKRGQKIAWLSRQDKNGWSLGFAIGTRTLWLTNCRFGSKEEVERAMKSKVIFIELLDLK